MNILLTGAAGFIGMHTARALVAAGHRVVGIDNLNDYYPVSLKEARLAQIEPLAGFRFERLDIADGAALMALFAAEGFDAVIHLAAQAGVRYSLQNPGAYVQANLVGFANLLEACRRHPVQHLVYASSSSVYGQNDKVPFAERDNTDHPVSLYAATKKANEAMAHSYAHLYGMPCTGLRFFTVYGPWGRPDMAPWLFTSAILEGRPIKVFNHGQLRRDFTYVDDIVDGIVKLLPLPPAPDGDGSRPDRSWAPWRLLNIGNHQPVPLMQFIETIEAAVGREAIKEPVGMQAGDVPATYADTSELAALTGFAPSTPLAEGIGRFVAWYRDYHGL
ncbi:NAD-dependent epimerase [Chitinimonas koreensis]|uniref:NAD-dependent epimerase n=1 Tax=Chitinimonas koreensis TaxID=356302 RepID=UPI0004264DE5|nr:NAD-dependent epimerase [Chitinimonas koreensis]QNM96906.1 NAD-dependent epimerase [Chitinimonas koreensis]